MTKDVYLNDIALAVPDHDVHRTFIAFAPSLLKDDRSKALFRRMAARCQIEHRYSVLQAHPDPARIDADGFYGPDAFPDTEKRMRFYETLLSPRSPSA